MYNNNSGRRKSDFATPLKTEQRSEKQEKEDLVQILLELNETISTLGKVMRRLQSNIREKNHLVKSSAVIPKRNLH